MGRDINLFHCCNYSANIHLRRQVLVIVALLTKFAKIYTFTISLNILTDESTSKLHCYAWGVQVNIYLQTLSIVLNTKKYRDTQRSTQWELH